MAYSVLANAMKSMGWLCGVVDASVYASSLPGEGTISTMDVVAPNLILLWPFSAPTTKIIWETKALTGGIMLGLVIIFAVGYIRSPWRKLPPSPRRLPILGNALYLRDKTWMFSKDCKERFGEFTNYVPRGMLRCGYGNFRRGYVPRRGWTADGCV
jgi:hypothetical protein